MLFLVQMEEKKGAECLRFDVQPGSVEMAEVPGVPISVHHVPMCYRERSLLSECEVSKNPCPWEMTSPNPRMKLSALVLQEIDITGAAVIWTWDSLTEVL
jgi:hypothetical protein